MEEIRCIRCSRGRDEVKLLDAISDNELVKICEECSLMENIPVIRKPSSEQLGAIEKSTPVRDRMRRMAGLTKESHSEQNQVQQVMNKLANPTIDSLRKRDYKSILDEKFQEAKKKNRPVNLVDNYNWLIMMARKQKRIDRNQLAKAIGVNETAIKMLEMKEQPDDALQIVSRIEQYLGLKLKIQNEDEIQVKNFMKQLSSSKPIIPAQQPRQAQPIQQSQQVQTHQIQSSQQVKPQVKQTQAPSRVLKFNPDAAKGLTIYDLQRIKQAREQAEKQSSSEEEILGQEIEFSDEEN